MADRTNLEPVASGVFRFADKAHRNRKHKDRTKQEERIVFDGFFKHVVLLAPFAVAGCQPVNQNIEKETEEDKPEDQELATVPVVTRDAEYVGDLLES